jgi:hypothetical protein
MVTRMRKPFVRVTARSSESVSFVASRVPQERLPPTCRASSLPHASCPVSFGFRVYVDWYWKAGLVLLVKANAFIVLS